jgi:hypothetical protein
VPAHLKSGQILGESIRRVPPRDRLGPRAAVGRSPAMDPSEENMPMSDHGLLCGVAGPRPGASIGVMGLRVPMIMQSTRTPTHGAPVTIMMNKSGTCHGRTGVTAT